MKKSEIGEYLGALLAAQEAEDGVVAYPALEHYASALVDLSRELNRPLVVPVGPAAERLAGAALLLSEGTLRVKGWNDDFWDQKVLLVAGVLLSPLPLHVAADRAVALGAREVVACGVSVDDVAESGSSNLAAYCRLDRAEILVRPKLAEILSTA